MIVDCHTHLGCEVADVSFGQHSQACKDVDVCFVLAGCGKQPEQANDDLADYVRTNSKAIGFAILNPLSDSIVRVKDLKSRVLDRQLRGAVLYCAEDRFHPSHSRAMRLYEAAEQLNIPIFFHNCPPYSPQAAMEFAQPCQIDEIATTFPKLNIILGRVGDPFVEQTFCLLGKHDRVFGDLTIIPHKIWSVYNLVLGAYEAGVMDKLLFGSGFPYTTPQACIETLLGFNKILSDTHLPQVPREKLRSIVERDSMSLLGFNK